MYLVYNPVFTGFSEDQNPSGSYPPPNENQTKAYIKTVAEQIGVYPDTVIDIEERGVLTVFIKAVIRMENGIQPYSDETIQKGIDIVY